jgi:predicted esterase
MQHNSPFEERFKIYEYADYSMLIPSDGDYQFCMFYFCGFGENASKYIYLLKQFFEFMTIKLPIKIVIPYSTYYKTYGTFLPDSYKRLNVYSWYDWKIEDGNYVITNDEARDTIVKELVDKEITHLESSERVIFAGFSQGGTYLLHILTQMKVKTLFNVIFKSRFGSYKNPYEGDGSLEAVKFNLNKFYCYFSRNEKVVTFDHVVKSILTLRKYFKNVEVKIDNSLKHVVDYNCLAYLDKIIVKHLYKYRITKF